MSSINAHNNSDVQVHDENDLQLGKLYMYMHNTFFFHFSKSFKPFHWKLSSFFEIVKWSEFMKSYW